MIFGYTNAFDWKYPSINVERSQNQELVDDHI